MIILPAIDLKDGKCVRLYKGDFATAHQVSEDAVMTALDFKSQGARMMHMVDLDGALKSRGENHAIIRRVIEESGLAVQLGGGLRSMEDLEAAFDMGVERCVIGSAAVTSPQLVSSAVRAFGEGIAVGIDARGGSVRVSGWTEDTGLDYLEHAAKMEALGVKYIIFTDIEKDGTLSGPPLESLKKLKERVSANIIASGGLTNLADAEALKKLGLWGAIIGKAYYAGTINLREAIEGAGEQCIKKG